MVKDTLRNTIYKSFEMFVAQPLSLLCSKIIRITNLKTDFLNNKSINVEILNDAIQVNMVNSDAAYNLLSGVVYKKKMQALRKTSLEGSLRSELQEVLPQNSAQTSPFILSSKAGSEVNFENKTSTIFN